MTSQESSHFPLFRHMFDDFGLTLVDSQLQAIVNKVDEGRIKGKSRGGMVRWALANVLHHLDTEQLCELGRAVDEHVSGTPPNPGTPNPPSNDLRHDLRQVPRLVVCAAILGKVTRTLICGPRHGDCLNTANLVSHIPAQRWECGFVDQDGKFMTREEAWEVADAAGQIRRPTGFERDYSGQRPAGVGDAGQLFSENLY